MNERSSSIILESIDLLDRSCFGIVTTIIAMAANRTLMTNDRNTVVDVDVVVVVVAILLFVIVNTIVILYRLRLFSPLLSLTVHSFVCFDYFSLSLSLSLPFFLSLVPV